MRVTGRTVCLLLLVTGCSGSGDDPAGPAESPAPASAPAQRAAPVEPVRYGVEGGQWRSLGGDPGNTKYAPLSGIDASNFSRMEVAWTWKTYAARWKQKLLRAYETLEYPFPMAEGFNPVPGLYPFPIARGANVQDHQATPLMVDGRLYGVDPIGAVYALDAGTGKQLWVHDPQSYGASLGGFDFLFPKHRGVTYWREGDDERIFLPTIDAYLIALDARTGRLVPSFGENGRVDLLEGLRGPPVRRLRDYFQTSPAALYGNTLVVGSSINDRPDTTRGIPGDVRAYDARSGAFKWVFHVVPAEGELGTETWEDESWRYSGAVNVWGPMTVDPERGTVFLTTSTPTNDFYGGHRRGDNLFAETLLCLDAETGERLWHFQLIRHGLWDYDPGAPANLVDIEVDGRAVRAVAQVTKQALTFVFDRESGEPMWPIEERPVPASDVPGEQTSPTQPFPIKPPPFDRQGTYEADLIDYTPELHAQALEIFRRYRTGPVFTPPSLEGSLVLPGPSGGSNWRGAAFDPETGILYVTSITQPTVVSVKPGDPERTDFRYQTDKSLPKWTSGDWAPDGLPLFKGPQSRITAIDLNRGELHWQVPNGRGPIDDPRLAPLNLPPLGSGGHACAMVTKTLVVVTGGLEPWIDQGDPYLRAYDKATGAVVGEVRLPAPIRNCPMTFMLDGKQHFVAAVAGEHTPPTLVALALPE